METPKEQAHATVRIEPGNLKDGTPAVGLLLSPGAITVDPEGEPCAGLFLEPWMARRVAYLLLLRAEEQEARARLRLTS